jgi:hypothetical protein
VPRADSRRHLSRLIVSAIPTDGGYTRRACRKHFTYRKIVPSFTRYSSHSFAGSKDSTDFLPNLEFSVAYFKVLAKALISPASYSLRRSSTLGDIDGLLSIESLLRIQKKLCWLFSLPGKELHITNWIIIP